MTRPLLILDLDETMISATERQPKTGHDFKVTGYYVRKRPHTAEFLRQASAWFDLAVWSSGGDDYVAAVVAHVFPPDAILQFVWGRSRCVARYDGELQRPFFLKDLKKVKRRGFDLNRVLIIDDCPDMVSRNYGNRLSLRPFEGEDGDRELLDVLPFLEWLKDQDNFRAVEKRTWRTRQPDGRT
jgi:carboxy-terminal domain RNA polymerase II polypeptide A small phosphatase